MQTIKGELTIDRARGVVWFNTEEGMVLRICNLPLPLPQGKPPNLTMGITHMEGANWTGRPLHMVKDMGPRG